MSKKDLGILALAGLGLLMFSKSASGQTTTPPQNVTPGYVTTPGQGPTVTQPIMPGTYFTSQPTQDPIVAGTPGMAVKSQTYNGYSVGDKILIDFWDSPPGQRQACTITYIEVGGSAYDGSNATLSVTLLDGSRTKQFSGFDFFNRNPQKTA